MASLEMVEKLRQRANITYDEAKAVLEACGDDLLEAMIYLEKEGKVEPPQGAGYYSTRDEAPGGGRRDPGPDPFMGDEPYQSGFGKLIRQFGRWIVGVIQKGNNNYFEVCRKGEHMLAVPVTILVLLVVFCFWVVVPLLVVGLFFKCRYHFYGPDLGESVVNNAMDTASRAVDGLKDEVLQHNKKGDE